ncbi:hypothetical protein [Cryobacterium sp. GrIS_2_6]|uniref:hypothetical protein n=1 Tax=Cryobacterium sp. GrIS_2_6 TaxID=3162785 RepID=UPI002E09A349|nr:hypothetical protein [Cryobacterium psychrotolerans]
MGKLVYANAIEYELPGSLDDLAGPSSGAISLPRTIYWGPEESVDLADPVDVQRMYQAVVRTGTAEEQCLWLNRKLLISAWRTLVLPVRCQMLWETKFSELSSL